MKIFKRIKNWWNTKAEPILEEVLRNSSEIIASALEDRDRDGLPDRIQVIAANVGAAVEALELILKDKAGLEKLTMFKVFFTRSSANFERDWRIVGPLVEVAVALLKRHK